MRYLGGAPGHVRNAARRFCPHLPAHIVADMQDPSPLDCANMGQALGEDVGEDVGQEAARETLEDVLEEEVLDWYAHDEIGSEDEFEPNDHDDVPGEDELALAAAGFSVP